MKRIIALTCFSLLVITLYNHRDYFNEDQVAESDLQDSTWNTFEQKDDQVIKREPTKQEIKDVKLTKKKPAKSQQGRSIASVPKKRIPLLPHGVTMPENPNFKNEISVDWQEKMAPLLMRFLDKETKLFVKKERSVIIWERDQARYAEQVYIKFQTKKGRHYSYHALVDSQTGGVINTWNRTNHERIGHERFQLKPFKP